MHIPSNSLDVHPRNNENLGALRVQLVDFGLVCFCCEYVFLVCAVAEGHEGGSVAPAPGLDNLPVDYDRLGPFSIDFITASDMRWTARGR
jgi:hypothetical protein